MQPFARHPDVPCFRLQHALTTRETLVDVSQHPQTLVHARIWTDQNRFTTLETRVVHRIF